jgi:hypothetical protein
MAYSENKHMPKNRAQVEGWAAALHNRIASNTQRVFLSAAFRSANVSAVVMHSPEQIPNPQKKTQQAANHTMDTVKVAGKVQWLLIWAIWAIWKGSIARNELPISGEGSSRKRQGV